MVDTDPKSLRTLQLFGLLTRIALGLFMVSAIATILVGAVMAFGESRLGGGFGPNPFDNNTYIVDYRTGEVSFVSIFSPTVLLVAGAFASGLLLVGIPFLIWLHRSYSFLDTNGLSGLRTTPGKAVATFLIPIVNLVYPPKIMRELYNRTMGEDEYQVDIDVNDIQVWWTCFLVGTLILVALTAIMWFNYGNYVYLTTPPGVNAGAALLTMLLLVASALHLFLVVGKISQAQRDWAAPDAMPA